MLQKTTFAILLVFICFQISVGQIAYFKADTPVSYGAPGLVSANPTPQEDYAYASAVRVGYRDPKIIAKAAGSPIGNGLVALAMLIMVDLHANTVAKHLSANGILNPCTVFSLASIYARSMKDSAKRIWLKENPVTKFKAIEIGFENFLTPLGLLDTEEMENVALLYATEVNNAGKNFGLFEIIYSMNIVYLPNPTPPEVETFIKTFKSAVSSSSILPEVFDLSQFPADAFIKSLYDYAYASAVRVGHSDPEIIAKAAGSPLGNGLVAFTMPLMVDLYANTVAKHLSANGILSPENAISLALKYASSMEDSAKRTWLKKNPETKFKAIEDGFVDFLTPLELLDAEKMENVALLYATELNNAGKSFV